MSKIVVDTSVWIDYLLNRRTSPEEALDDLIEEGSEIVVPDLAPCEVLQGGKTEREVSGIREALSRFELASIGGADAAEKSALHYRRLRRRGVTIRSTIDGLIAPFVIEHGYRPLHNDRDDDAFQNALELKVFGR